MKKIVSTVAVILTMVMVLSGCSNTDVNKEMPNGKSETEKKTKSSNEEKNEISGKVEFFSQKEEIVHIMQAIVDDFHVAYPNVEVELVTVADSNQVLKSRLATGQMPEVLTEWPLNPDYRLYANEGFLYNMEGQEYLNNANQEILDMTKVDGGYYAVPLSLNYTGVYYNVDIFEENGVEIPNTYSELIEVCKTLEAKGVQPFMVSDKDIWTIGAFADRAMGLIFDDQGELFESVGKGEMSIADSEGFMTMIDQILEIRQYSGSETLGIGYEQAVADFANGKAAMMYQGTWVLPLLKKVNPEMNVAVFPYPAAVEADTKVGVNIDNAVCISADIDSIEAANVFVGFITSTEIAQMYADMDGSPSAINGVKSTTEEFKLLEDLVTEGKTFRISRTFWKPGMIIDLQGNIQTLILEKDIDAFVKVMDESIKIYYAD